MFEINDLNGASTLTHQIAQDVMQTDGPLFGCEMGVAWGGGIEHIGKLWSGRGIIFGFDTFEGHPKQLGDICPDTIADGGQNAHATYCMDPQYVCYADLSYQYDDIRASLDKQNLHNVILVKGLVDENINVDFIPYLNYVLLDMDFPIAMRNGYRAVKDKIVSGGYLCLHDVIPYGHIRGLNEFYKEIIAAGEFEAIAEHPSSYLAIMRKK